jgi:hypothetical protein
MAIAFIPMITAGWNGRFHPSPSIIQTNTAQAVKSSPAMKAYRTGLGPRNLCRCKEIEEEEYKNLRASSVGFIGVAPRYER